MPVTRTTRSSAVQHITTTLAKSPATSAAPSVGQIVLDLSVASSASSAETSERDSSSAGSGSAAGKQKRYRDRVDGELEKLQELWDRTQYPPRKERAGLATELGIEIKIVDIWFQNKRRAIKKQQPKEVEYVQKEQHGEHEMTTPHEVKSRASLDLSVSVHATAESSPPSVALPVNSAPQYPSSPSSRTKSPCVISRSLDGLGSHLLPLKDIHKGSHSNVISTLASAATLPIPLLPKLKSLPPDPRSSHYASSTNNRYALVPALFPPQDSFSAPSSPVTILKSNRDSHGVRPKHSQALLPSPLISSNFSLSENSHPRIHSSTVKKGIHNAHSTGALDKACEERRRRHKQHRERRPHKGKGGVTEQPRTIEGKEFCVDHDDSGYASGSSSRFLESDVRTSSIEPDPVYSPRMTEAAQILMSFKTGRIF